MSGRRVSFRDGEEARFGVGGAGSAVTRGLGSLEEPARYTTTRPVHAAATAKANNRRISCHLASFVSFRLTPKGVSASNGLELVRAITAP